MRFENDKQIEYRQKYLVAQPLPWTNVPPNITPANTHDFRAWCFLGNLPQKWVNAAKLYQLQNAWKSEAYYTTILNLKEDEIKTGKQGRSIRTHSISAADFDQDGDAFDLPATSPPPERQTPNLFDDSKPLVPTSTPNETIQTTIAAMTVAAEKVIAPRLKEVRETLQTELSKKITSDVVTAVKDRMDKAIAGVEITDKVKQQICVLAESSAQKVLEAALPLRVEITAPTLAQPLNLGLQHERFPTLMKLLNARGRGGFRLNIWLTGPTGSGKTTAVENATSTLAEAGQFSSYVKAEGGRWELPNVDLNGLQFDSPFGGDSSLDADYKVIGYDKADGSFRWTTFLRIFCFGGIYIADEIDNWNPSALVALNAPLANGWISTPQGILKRHSDCCIIAAANTWGLGATSDYVGRTRLDAATVNRFTTKLDWPYDEKLESAIATADGGRVGALWAKLVQEVRAEARKQGLQIILSPRNTYDGIAALNAGFTVEEVVDMVVLAGLEPEYKQSLKLSDSITAFKRRLDLRLEERSAPPAESVPHSNGHSAVAKMMWENFCKAIRSDNLVAAVNSVREYHDPTKVSLLEAQDFVYRYLKGYYPTQIETFLTPPGAHFHVGAGTSL
jgi:hypothetical protein